MVEGGFDRCMAVFELFTDPLCLTKDIAAGSGCRVGNAFYGFLNAAGNEADMAIRMSFHGGPDSAAVCVPQHNR